MISRIISTCIQLRKLNEDYIHQSMYIYIVPNFVKRKRITLDKLTADVKLLS